MKSFEVAAVVAGGASGLGAATVRALAGRGAAVTILDLNEDAGRALVAELGGHTTFLRTDVTDVDSAGRDRRGDRGRTGRSGTPSTVPASAGPSAPSTATARRNGLPQFTRTVMVNLVGTFHVLRLAAAAMARTERGVIVNTASIAAYGGQIGQVAYAASKGGIVGLTLPAARDPVQRRRPGLHDRPRAGRHAAAGQLARGGPHSAGGRHPVPAAAGPARRLGRAGPRRRRARLPEREAIRMDGALRMAPR
jgi:NAD(P)-dependent dehydrogenase (short-subunit alcohol dehydrogenase family)